MNPLRKFVIFISLISISGLTGIGMIRAGWFRSQPSSMTQELATGITYHRVVRTIPRPIVLHVVEIILKNKKLQFLVTPSQPILHGEIRAKLTSRFLTEYRQTVAINGSYFYPFREYWSPYPAEGEPVHILGHAISHHQTYSQPQIDFSALYVTDDNQFSSVLPSAHIVHAIAGREWLLKHGQTILTSEMIAADKPYPRTAIAFDATQQRLWLIVVDGKQPNYSDGIYLQELADYLFQLGADTALCLDGGGSSTLVIADVHGQARILNSPIHQGWAGRERPVANHFGVQIID
jgi:Phosphodiester glycosidase